MSRSFPSILSPEQGSWSCFHPATCTLASVEQRGRVSQDQGAHQEGKIQQSSILISRQIWVPRDVPMKVLHKPSEVPACVMQCVSDVCEGEREKHKRLMLIFGLIFCWWNFVSCSELRVEGRKRSGRHHERSVEEVKSTVPAQSTPSGARTQPYQVPFALFLPGQAPPVRTCCG